LRGATEDARVPHSATATQTIANEIKAWRYDELSPCENRKILPATLHAQLHMPVQAMAMQ
jgi:hypothetical protein